MRRSIRLTAWRAPLSLRDRREELPRTPTVSVIVCAYTERRWRLLEKSIASVNAQTSPPAEIILCIDHNEDLLRRSEQQFLRKRPAGSIPVTVLANKYDGHLGSARNTAAECAYGDVLAFLDDDAAAEADWLERLIGPYGDQKVGAVGGAPLPVFEEAGLVGSHGSSTGYSAVPTRASHRPAPRSRISSVQTCPHGAPSWRRSAASTPMITMIWTCATGSRSPGTRSCTSHARWSITSCQPPGRPGVISGGDATSSTRAR